MRGILQWIIAGDLVLSEVEGHGNLLISFSREPRQVAARVLARITCAGETLP
jgi:hypothetical protein